MKDLTYVCYGMIVNRLSGHTPKAAHEALVALL